MGILCIGSVMSSSYKQVGIGCLRVWKASKCTITMISWDKDWSGIIFKSLSIASLSGLDTKVSRGIFYSNIHT